MESNKGSRKKASSYLDTLNAAHDAKGVDGEQAGKKHEEEVNNTPNWNSDKRDEVGKAATKMAAAKLRKIADVLEKMAGDGFDKVLDGKNALNDYHNDNDILVSSSVKEAMASMDDEFEITAALELMKSAEHPIDHAERADKDDSGANGDPQMGDDEWVDIGSADFNDKRDEIGRAGDNE